MPSLQSNPELNGFASPLLLICMALNAIVITIAITYKRSSWLDQNQGNHTPFWESIPKIGALLLALIWLLGLAGCGAGNTTTPVARARFPSKFAQLKETPTTDTTHTNGASQEPLYYSEEFPYEVQVGDHDIVTFTTATDGTSLLSYDVSGLNSYGVETVPLELPSLMELRTFKDVGLRVDTVQQGKATLGWTLASARRQSMVNESIQGVPLTYRHQAQFEWRVTGIAAGNNSTAINIVRYTVMPTGIEHDQTLLSITIPIAVVTTTSTSEPHIGPIPIGWLPSALIPIALGVAVVVLALSNFFNIVSSIVRGVRSAIAFCKRIWNYIFSNLRRKPPPKPPLPSSPSKDPPPTDGQE